MFDKAGQVGIIVNVGKRALGQSRLMPAALPIKTSQPGAGDDQVSTAASLAAEVTERAADFVTDQIGQGDRQGAVLAG
jgi:hypothetical protein